MSIIQISKIQQRSGNLVDLPQLDEAELGWASDAKLLFIGNESTSENVEVLTSYSTIDFNQLNGAVGNLNITNPLNGQVLSYDSASATWINKGSTGGGLINLGNVSNVKITGGAIGYTLETDGLGNLSWVPKGTLYTNIIGLSASNPIIMTVDNTTPYTNDAEVTITGVQGAGNTILNGNTFFVRLENDYPTSGNVRLYTSAGEVGPVDGTGLVYTNSPNAIATSATIGSGGGITVAEGVTYSIQYNDNNLLAGDNNITWNFNTNLLTVNGNISTGNLLVSSNTLVANLNADLLDGYQSNISTQANTVVVRNADGNIAGNNFSATGNISTLGIKTDNYYYANSVPIPLGGTYGNSNVAAYLPTYTGNITAANVTLTGYNIRSIGTSISAAGTTQGTATLLSKEINIVTAVSVGEGVLLPVAVPGMIIIVNNTTATDLQVYPNTGAQIGSLATNNSFLHVGITSLQYYAVSSTQWYTVGAAGDVFTYS